MPKIRNTISAGLLFGLVASPALADPPVDSDTGERIPPVFCFRITDVEQVAGFEDRFNFEFEVLNWTNMPATGMSMMRTVGATATEGAAPFIAAASVDPDGRGGPPGGSDIGPGVADMPEMQSGRGNHALPNDWSVAGSSATAASWTGGTAIPNRDLIGETPIGGLTPSDLVPIAGGLTDGMGDTAIDGGVGTSSVALGVETPGSGNVLDGFVLTIDDFDVGECVAFNWFLLDGTLPIGTAASCNSFGFGTLGLMRSPGDAGPMFVGNSGFGGGQVDFFGNVGVVPADPPLVATGPLADEPAVFLAEFGAGLTAPFSNPSDNTVDAPTNTTLIAEPAALGLMGLAGLALAMAGRRRR